MTKQSLSLRDFVNIDELLHSSKFQIDDPMELLGAKLKSFLGKFLADLGVKADGQPLIKGEVSKHAHISGPVYIDEGALVEPTAMITGPCYIGPKAEVRHGAYIRGNVYVGAKCVVGHTTEVKGAVFFDGAKAGHFAYIGDSILGRNVNLGAGTKLANLKITDGDVYFRDPKTNAQVSSGLRKFGAIVGDDAQTGCNAVLAPGVLMLPKTAVLPCVFYRGTLRSGLGK
jgi:UDP-N-acetylglucosamine diphosphorylase / glucose-1-phosphate thymidylyltransferase / UDP-N-acetylgalactosamine diphosphorylase / glucosamine-1-phosphate N-acetyltransferase / galactosamine-1-phosphate N-acetyltransferase